LPRQPAQADQNIPAAKVLADEQMTLSSSNRNYLFD